MNAWIALNGLSDDANHQGLLHRPRINPKSDRLLVSDPFPPFGALFTTVLHLILKAKVCPRRCAV